MTKDSFVHRYQLRLGIRQKMIIALLVVLSLALGVTGWFTFSDFRESALREVQINGQKLARFAAQSLIYSVVGYDYHTIQLMLDNLMASTDIVYAEVKNSKGASMASAGGQAPPDQRVKLFSNDILLDNEKIGTLTIALDTTRIVNDLEAKQTAVVTREAVIILLIPIVEFLFLSYIVVRPVRFIHGSIKHQYDKLDHRIPPLPFDTRDEFTDLADAFNHMFDRLERRQNDLRFALQQAEQATRAKSAFLANISHQFRTPLNSVLGYAQVLRRELGEQSNYGRAIEAIDAGGKELLTLVNQIIDVARSESDQGNVAEIDFDLSAILDEVASVAAAACREKGLEWRFEKSGLTEVGFVKGDVEKLREVLSVLLENAIQFTDRGTVLLRVDRRPDAAVFFAVEDTGIGIEAGQLPFLFRVFNNDEQRLAAGGSHVGVSLALAYKQLDAMGGRLAVESTVGAGSRFSFTLALPPAHAATQSSTVESQAATETLSAAGSTAGGDAMGIDIDASRFADVAVPAELLAAIEELAEHGMISDLESKIEEVRALHGAFGDCLQRLAERVQLERIAELVREMKARNHV